MLAEGVGERLAELYPDDRATGFAPGELRGWFWMKVPGAELQGGRPPVSTGGARSAAFGRARAD